MITCPWCGTSYKEFQSNCKNCGGPLPAEKINPALIMQEPPPPAPREFSNLDTRSLLFSDPSASNGIGLIIAGVWLTIWLLSFTSKLESIIPSILFIFCGMIVAASGVYFIRQGYHKKQKTIEVLRNGQTVLGEVVKVEEKPIEGWEIRYRYTVNGQKRYYGKVMTTKAPEAHIRTGQKIYVLYLPQEPTRSAPYPHP